MRDPELADEFIVIAPSKKKSKKPRQLTLAGNCPYCFGTMQYVWNRTTVVGAADAAIFGQGNTELTITIHCTCPLDHSGRPHGVTGCGQGWTTVVEV